MRISVTMRALMSVKMLMIARTLVLAGIFLLRTRGRGRALKYFVQFPPVQPDPSALGAIVNLHPLPLA